MPGIYQKTIKPLGFYKQYFPKANMNEVTVKKNAVVSDTVKFIPKVVRETLFHTERFALLMKGKTLLQTCKNIWQFVYDHIAYEPDEKGKEQVRSPARMIADLKGDCDCFSTFISSALCSLGIFHIFRITKYKKDYFQHIYPIVPLAGGGHITMDCVVEQFNYEEPYKEKQDYPMELNYLNGVPSKADYVDEDEQSGLRELGALFRRKNTAPQTKIGQKIQQATQTVKAAASKTIHALNKVNPATVVLRNGLLAAMKLNMGKVAQRLKYAYLPDAEAQKRGMDMSRFKRLKDVMQKLEKIFYGAGGKPENLKSAILTGRGNANKAVNGLGYPFDENVPQMSAKTPLHLILGQEIFYSENMDQGEELQGLGELGEPITAASMTAASGVIATLAALLKNIGELFPKGKKENEDFTETANANATPEETADLTRLTEDLVTQEENTAQVQQRSVTTEPPENFEEISPATNTPTDVTPTDTDKPSWWEENKKWLKPSLWITGGGLAALGIGIAVYKSKKKPKAAPQLSGVNKKGKGKKAAKKEKPQVKIKPLCLI
jgi:hypothetical protein